MKEKILQINFIIFSLILFLMCSFVINAAASEKKSFQQDMSIVATLLLQTDDLDENYKNENILRVLNFWVTWISIITVILLSLTAVNLFYQYRHTQRIASDLRKQFKEEIDSLKKTYHLNVLKTPEAILGEARNEYKPLIESMRGKFESVYKEMRRDLEKKISMQEVKIEKIDKKYTLPEDLQERILRQVLNAFLEVKSLTSDEQSKITDRLTVERKSQGKST